MISSNFDRVPSNDPISQIDLQIVMMVATAMAELRDRSVRHQASAASSNWSMRDSTQNRGGGGRR